ncbi:MAG: helix-turn-helix transcriptional regulator [Muribaculaceae bacterium]|nr:helix-turn-helix transcriptional regulator [Muribaculaceae bacterium]
MDIVTRLKQFMMALNIANSQFADTCRIPRPTISQILNGRNKKISDELISKIHEAYPQLSVMWLMFGEGSMLVDSKITMSEPKIGDSIDFGTKEDVKNESIMQELDFDNPIEDQNSMLSKSVNSVQKLEYKETNPSMSNVIAQTDQISVKSNAKKVIEIRVFYNDNSYEIFVPQMRK